MPTPQQPATNGNQHYTTTQPMPQQQPPPQAQYVQSQPDQPYTQTQAMPQQMETVPQTGYVPHQTGGGPTFVPKEGGTFVPKAGVSEMPSADKPPADTQ